MSFLFKIVLLSSLLFSTLLSNIDECKSDLYYANGIMINMEVDRYVHEEQWLEKITDMFIDNQEAFNKLGSIKVSYNASQGFFDDIFESFEQVMSNEWGWSAFSSYFRTYLELKGYQESLDLHRPNLTTQVEAYKQSIKDGHGVIVIAHSQGNYYTNEAYEELEEWMKDYFYMFGVAIPANHVAGYNVGDTTAPYVKFHNDIINFVVTGLPSNREDSHHQGFPSYDAHDFYDSYLTNTETKNDIFNFIVEKIQAHDNAPSQWETESEQNIGTKEYRITLKHKFDITLPAIDNVYPFAPSKKLYYVQGEFSENISGYVKASYGGFKIEDTWVDQDTATELKRLVHTDATLPHEILNYKCKAGYVFDIGLGTCSPVVVPNFSVSGSTNISRFYNVSAWELLSTQQCGYSHAEDITMATGAYGNLSPLNINTTDFSCTLPIPYSLYNVAPTDMYINPENGELYNFPNALYDRGILINLSVSYVQSTNTFTISLSVPVDVSRQMIYTQMEECTT